MRPVAAVPYKGGFVVITEDGAVYRYNTSKKCWKNLGAVPGTKIAIQKHPSSGKPARKRQATSTDVADDIETA
jgi:hypothetical protein